MSLYNEFEAGGVQTGATPYTTRGPQAGENDYRWATVAQSSPLLVTLDGEDDPLPEPPDTLVAPLTVGQRVWVQLFARRVLVLGAAQLDLSPTDTGWVDIAISAGFAIQPGSPPQVRRIGKRVQSRGGWANTGITANAVIGAIGVIPNGFRPPTGGPTVLHRAGTSSGPAAATMFINVSGTIDIRTNTTLSGYYFLGNSWLID